MRIVDVSEFYAERGGGVRTYVNAKLRAAAQRGHQLTVIAPGPRQRVEPSHGGRIHWIPGPPMPLDPRYYILHRQAAVHAVLDQVKPHLIEGSSLWTGGLFAARWHGAAARALVFHQDPVAVYGHTFLDHSLSVSRIDALLGAYWAYVRRLSRRFDATVTSGAWLERKLEGFGIHRPVAVPFGIDKAAFSPPRSDQGLRRDMLHRCGAPSDARLLITVSRHHPEKRLGTVLSGFAEAARHTPLALVVFGDGPLRPWIERKAKRIAGVHVAGFMVEREKLASALASADALLHGSAAETYGLVIAEAMCSGLPLIVPDRGGAADLAGPAYSELYRAGDTAGCAAAIERLLHRDPHELRRACRAAAERVRTMSEHFDQLFELYARLAKVAAR